LRVGRLALGGVLAAGAALAIGAGVHSRSSSPSRASSRAKAFAVEAQQLPQPEKPAFTVGRPRLLSRHESRARYAPVAKAVVARAEPAATARPVAPLALETSEGTTNLVLVIGERRRPDALWVHVRLPVLPNNRTGWVPRAALGGYHFVQTRLVVDRERLKATLFRDGREVFGAPVGIGSPGSPTPAGEFYVRDRVSGFGDPFYGPIAFGTSARSAVLTDWPAGGFVGIHGTNEPGLIPGRISHGCVRLRNADILRLSRLMPVGTPVTIR
jgi:lipoprotein-anchoring transpeptidase ErfK/SrfK